MRNLKYFVAHQEEVKVKTFDELREAYRKPTQAEIDADRKKDGKSKDTSSRYKNMKKKVYGNMMGGLKKEENDLDEAVSKVKTTMPDKVASSAIRFGLKAKSQGGSVSISGPKGKLHNFLRAIIGRSSYGDASELDEANESVEMNEEFVVKYAKNKRGPIYQTKFKTQSEAEKFLAQKRKEGMNGIVSKAGKPVSMQKMADLQKESVDLEEAVDFEKMSKELLKKKNLGIEFEKAAAFARVMFMNSSVHVQDKAMKGLLTLIKGIDDLTVKTTLIKILKDNGFKVKGGRVMREEVELDEAVQPVTKIKFDYKDTMPKDPKPSDVGGLKQDWNNDRTAVRSAVKPLGGLVTDSEAPSRTNKFVGTLSVGTRGDASKLSNSAIQKAVKSKGAEIQNNQFMSESVEFLDENYRTLATHGMGTESKSEARVGLELDYYEPKNGDKRMGKITKMTRSGYVVKDEKDGKSHAFAFHDRVKAKEILAKSK